MTDRYPLLLKHGWSTPYYRCEACLHFVRKLSNRGWCGVCEKEFPGVIKRAKAVVSDMEAALILRGMRE